MMSVSLCVYMFVRRVCSFNNSFCCVAIWDNRSTFHSATFDYEGLGERFGHRAVGIGEQPYLDPNGGSRTDDLAGRHAG